MGHLGSRKADGPCGGQEWRPSASIKGLDCLSKPLPRNWIRQYPALVNCTTINWFSEWPREALLEVAEKYLVGVDLGTQENVSAPHPWHPAPGPLLHPSSTCPHSAFSILSHGPPDPQEGGQDLRHHALVSGTVLPEDAARAAETQLRHPHQLLRARVRVQEVCRGVEGGEAQGAR